MAFPSDSAKELSPAQKWREENLKLLQEELTDREVIMKSNVYFDRNVRKYKVSKVVETTVEAGPRILFGVRLVNPKANLEEQPFLRYPPSKIIKKKEGDKHKLTLTYPAEIDIERGFRHLHKKTRPDMEIYIYY
ncbi:MAG: hypothetical protein AB1797_03015 [bacterium]